MLILSVIAAIAMCFTASMYVVIGSLSSWKDLRNRD
jgi:hypothetical protein